MTPLAPVLAASPAATTDFTVDDEFDLDLRIIESAAPTPVMMCDTGDSCGSTCSTTACNTTSNDPV